MNTLEKDGAAQASPEPPLWGQLSSTRKDPGDRHGPQVPAGTKTTFMQNNRGSNLEKLENHYVCVLELGRCMTLVGLGCDNGNPWGPGPPGAGLAHLEGQPHTVPPAFAIGGSMPGLPMFQLRLEI